MLTSFTVLSHEPGVTGSRGLHRPGSGRRCFQNPAPEASQLLHELLVRAAHASPESQALNFVGKGPHDRDLFSDSEEGKFLAQGLVVGALQRAKRG